MSRDWREDDDSRITRALAAMNERVEELEGRISLLEDEVGFLEVDDDLDGLGFRMEDDDDEDDNLAGVEDEDIECDVEEVCFLGDIDGDEEEEDQRVLDLIEASKGDSLHDHADVARELGGGK